MLPPGDLMGIYELPVIASSRETVRPCKSPVVGPDFLQGDCTKARQKLNWKPRVTFDELVREMVDADVELMRNNPNA
ncbi:hypothetical protein DUI87_08289 [Hirundo rustica rustica]|uniref:NAD(P)-binding domain-containing protein n=1 Tax=Hirundo rustica rustica TaxID=333673 RepID=A0A3M0KZB9_HIRRU|nr:hypothetical protein DUI87_08289 [Hirundo rustica rustica]